MTNKATTNSQNSVRNLRTGICPSLTGKSNLTYEIGLDEQSDVVLRVTGNSNAGAFNAEWMKLKAVRAALDKAPKSETVTADLLMPLYRGMSMNTPFFVFAVLRHEGLVKPSSTVKRRYDRAAPSEFDAVAKALSEGKGAAAVVDKKNRKAKGTKAYARKKPSVSSQKKARPS